jgi:hypothetical protein
MGGLIKKKKKNVKRKKKRKECYIEIAKSLEIKCRREKVFFLYREIPQIRGKRRHLNHIGRNLSLTI